MLESGTALIDAPTRLPSSGLLSNISAGLVAKLMRNYKHPQTAQIEIALEVVRRTSFPQYPCRQSVLFACETWGQLERVSKYIRREGGLHGPVYEISGRAHGPFDGDLPYVTAAADPIKRALCYWRGCRTNEPVLEWLVEAPIIIGRQVGTI